MSEVAPVNNTSQAPSQPVPLPVPPAAPPKPVSLPLPGDQLDLSVKKGQETKQEETSGFWNGVKTVGQRTVQVLLGIPLGIVGFVVGPIVDAGRYVYKGIVGDPNDDTLAGRLVDETRENSGKTLAPIAGAAVGLPAGLLQGAVEGLNFGANVGVNVGKWLTGDE